MSDVKQDLVRSIRTHLWGAGLFLMVLLAMFMVFSAWMSISGAVIASGSIVVETNVKTVKHREGGIVAAILVSDGDSVEVGDLLLRLDDVVAKANLSVVTTQLNNLRVTRARLIAERDGHEIIRFPAELVESLGADPKHKFAELIKIQDQLLKARRASFSSRIDQLLQQIKQLKTQVEGLKIQNRSKRAEIVLIGLQLPGLEILLEKSLISASRVYDERRQKMRLDGELGDLMSQIAQAGIAIGEREMQIQQLQDDNLSTLLQQLQEATAEISRLTEQSIALRDQLSRMDIRAPQAGIVHQLAIHTRGGVISPAEPVLQIVPQGDDLLIEVQIAPTDIDQLYIGQPAVIRLPGFNQRTTPELRGEIRTMSAETTRDEATGLTFYVCRLQLHKDEINKLKGISLMPGMPVEALLTTNDRTILSYLTKPLTDQITRALREE